MVPEDDGPEPSTETNRVGLDDTSIAHCSTTIPSTVGKAMFRVTLLNSTLV